MHAFLSSTDDLASTRRLQSNQESRSVLRQKSLEMRAKLPLLLLIVSHFLLISGVFCENDRVVETKNGQVRGRRETSLRNKVDFFAFRGIPYAKPPLGDLRFKVSFFGVCEEMANFWRKC